MFTLYEAIGRVLRDPALKFETTNPLHPNRRYLLYADTEVVLADSEFEGMEARMDIMHKTICMTSNAFSDKTTALLINCSTVNLWFDAHDPLNSLEFIKEWAYVNWVDRETEYDIHPMPRNDTFKGYEIGDLISCTLGNTGTKVHNYKLHLISESDRTIYVTPVPTGSKVPAFEESLENKKSKPTKKSPEPFKLHDATPAVKLFNLVSPIYEALFFDDLEEKSRAKAATALRSLRRFKGSPSYDYFFMGAIGRKKAESLINAGGLNFINKEALCVIYTTLLSNLLERTTGRSFFTDAHGQLCSYNGGCYGFDESEPGHAPLYKNAFSLLKHFGVEKDHLVKEPLTYTKAKA